MSSQVLSPQDTSLTAWVRFLRTYATVKGRLSSELLAEHGLTISDYEALLALSQAEDGRMRRIDLAGRLLLSPSGVTRLLDGLERQGLVRKGTCDSDARVTYAVLTDAGREKLGAASDSHLVGVRQVFEESLSAEELDSLAGLLGRLPGGDVEYRGECAA